MGELDAVVPGEVLGRQTTVRGVIEPRVPAFFFDAVESDEVLAFRKRGREPVATISSEHLLPPAMRILDVGVSCEKRLELGLDDLQQHPPRPIPQHQQQRIVGDTRSWPRRTNKGIPLPAAVS